MIDFDLDVDRFVPTAPLERRPDMPRLGQVTDFEPDSPAIEYFNDRFHMARRVGPILDVERS